MRTKLREDEYSTMRDRVTEALKRTFRPEFLNRLDGVMVFRNLTKEQITEIVDLELNRVRVQLKEQEITLEATDEVKGYLADAGYDADYGARPLRRVIQDKLEDRLSEGLLGGWLKPGDTVRVELDSAGEIQLVTMPATDRGELTPGRSDGLSRGRPDEYQQPRAIHAAVYILGGLGGRAPIQNQTRPPSPTVKFEMRTRSCAAMRPILNLVVVLCLLPLLAAMPATALAQGEGSTFVPGQVVIGWTPDGSAALAGREAAVFDVDRSAPEWQAAAA